MKRILLLANIIGLFVIAFLLSITVSTTTAFDNFTGKTLLSKDPTDSSALSCDCATTKAPDDNASSDNSLIIIAAIWGLVILCIVIAFIILCCCVSRENADERDVLVTYRCRTVEGRRHHGPGRHQDMEISFFKEELHVNGVFSSVYSATLTSPKILPIAIKKCWPRNSTARRALLVNTTTRNDDDREDANSGKAEIELLSKLKHQHVVLLLYSFSVWVDSDVCNCMVLEFMPTDMGKMMKNRHQRRIDILDIKLYTWQIFSALDYINSKGIAHRDVKPANLLVHEEVGLLKLADFGNAKVLDPTEEYPPYQVTRYYRAPELCFGSRRYTTKVDTWAAACILGELLIGRPVFPGLSATDQGRLIIETFGYPNAEQLKAMGVESRPRFARKSPRGLKVLLPSQLIDSTAYELIESILRYEPYLRLSYEFILGHSFFDVLRVQPVQQRRNGQLLPPLDYWISEESTQETETLQSE